MNDQVQATADGIKPEYLFAGLLAGFGLLFALIIPPCQVPDETSHLLRAYHISEGYLFPVMVNHHGGGDLPDSLRSFIGIFGSLPFRNENHIDLEHLRRAAQLPLNPEQRHRVDYHTGYYPFVAYGPQALGLALGRLAGFNLLGIFLVGRLVNLALSVLLVFLAIRSTPVYKLVFGMVALLPMSVQQFASLSYDAAAIGLTLLYTALLLRLVLVDRPQVRWGEIAALLLVALWLTLCKFPYAVVTLLFLAVPAAQLGSRRRWLIVGSLLFATVLGATILYTQFKKFAPGHMNAGQPNVNIEGQTHFILSTPGRYAEVLFGTIAEHGRLWIDQLAFLGWLDTPVNPLAMELVLVVLVLIGLSAHEVPVPLTRWLKLLCLAAASGCAVLILTSCYICGSTVKAKMIIGPQGRYFLPLIPLFLLSLTNRWLVVAAPRLMLLALAAGSSTAVLLVACANIVRRYYFAPELHLKFAPLALAAGATFWLLVLWGTRRHLLASTGPPLPQR